MARKATGSIYATTTGVGIRWTEHANGRTRRPCKEGFPDEEAARRWFVENISPLTEQTVVRACDAIRRWARRHRKPTSASSWVYVLCATDLKRLKIGLSVVPAKRIRDLRCSAPGHLEPLLLIPGGESLEQKLLEVTRPFMVLGAGTEWRSIEALEVIIALVRERVVVPHRFEAGSFPRPGRDVQHSGES